MNAEPPYTYYQVQPGDRVSVQGVVTERIEGIRNLVSITLDSQDRVSVNEDRVTLISTPLPPLDIGDLVMIVGRGSHVGELGTVSDVSGGPPLKVRVIIGGFRCLFDRSDVKLVTAIGDVYTGPESP